MEKLPQKKLIWIIIVIKMSENEKEKPAKEKLRTRLVKRLSGPAGYVGIGVILTMIAIVLSNSIGNHTITYTPVDNTTFCSFTINGTNYATILKATSSNNSVIADIYSNKYPNTLIDLNQKCSGLNETPNCIAFIYGLESISSKVCT